MTEFLKKRMIQIALYFTLMGLCFLLFELALRTIGFESKLDPLVYKENHANQKHQIEWNGFFKVPFLSSEKVDPVITIETNSLGMRGPELPKKPEEYFKFLSMGGSTTHCLVLSEGTTWTDHLGARLKEVIPNLWYANAGVDGQSTTGHVEYLQAILKENWKPNFILFLIGANEQNEVYLNSGRDFGKKSSKSFVRDRVFDPLKDTMQSSIHHFFKFAYENRKYSKVLMFAADRYRGFMARKLNIGHAQLPPVFASSKSDSSVQTIFEREVAYDHLEERDSNLTMVQIELSNQQEHQQKVRHNIQRLIEMTRKKGVEPIFLTQPALFGPGIDPVTQKDLGRMILQEGNVGWGQGLTGLEMWTMLEAYNEITRDEAQKQGVFLIDMALKFPRNSLFYYDFVHYSKPGAQEFAKILSEELCPHLARTYPQALAGRCQSSAP